jgi:taurine dioxygenase
MTFATASDAVPPSPLPFQVRPLSPALGAELIGLDLNQPMNDDLFASVQDAWHRHLVIVFRDQHLTEDEQVRFAERFGPISRSTRGHFLGQNPAIMLISNIREDGKQIGALPDGEMQFHIDQSHQERPAMATMLYSLEVPSVGGNTLFANGYAAYETLPAAIKQKIEGRKALNAYDYDAASTKRGTKVREGVPAFWHPIARTHPVTGRRSLFVNRLMTVAVEGLSDDEGEELPNTLFDHLEQRSFVYEHVWRPNDVLLWDNRCTLHARTDFSDKERRLMRRVAIKGERPI